MDDHNWKQLNPNFIFESFKNSPHSHKMAVLGLFKEWQINCSNTLWVKLMWGVTVCFLTPIELLSTHRASCFPIRDCVNIIHFYNP